MVVPPAQRTSGAAGSPKSSTPSVTPFTFTVLITPTLRGDVLRDGHPAGRKLIALRDEQSLERSLSNPGGDEAPADVENAPAAPSLGRITTTTLKGRLCERT